MVKTKEYKGFKMESNGAFFSGDGYKIISVPDWLLEDAPKFAKEKLIGMQAPDAVLYSQINKLYEIKEKLEAKQKIKSIKRKE